MSAQDHLRINAQDSTNQTGSISTAQEVYERLVQLGWGIAVAESLTGGLLSSALVDVPGVSKVYSGAVIAYATDLKHSLLSVDSVALEKYGPVTETVALQMARGVRKACATAVGDCADSLRGIGHVCDAAERAVDGHKQGVTDLDRTVNGSNRLGKSGTLSDENNTRPSACLFPEVGLATTGVAGPDVDPHSGQLPGTVWIAVSTPLGERSELHRLDGSRQEIRHAAVELALQLVITQLSVAEHGLSPG